MTERDAARLAEVHRELAAEREAWIKAVGLVGWQDEKDRRGAERLARSRARRLGATPLPEPPRQLELPTRKDAA